MRKIVFLDRDGTICEDSDYLDDFRKMKIFSFSYDALAIIKNKGYEIYVITNQSGVAKGKFSLEEAENQKKFVLAYFNREKKLIEDYLYCPHHKEGVVEKFSFECNCRKPKTGMIEKINTLSEIDRKNSYVVGDKLIDIELAVNLGVNPVLVLTGYGNEEQKKIMEKDYNVLIFNNLLDFANSII
ncbi:MAG: HAD-IIIA family hydrolase [Proteobacteria bacterium]|nr:HAD-IIIA family hydrolase [Pseudomonadota bacterium]